MKTNLLVHYGVAKTNLKSCSVSSNGKKPQKKWSIHFEKILTNWPSWARRNMNFISETRIRLTISLVNLHDATWRRTNIPGAPFRYEKIAKMVPKRWSVRLRIWCIIEIFLARRYFKIGDKKMGKYCPWVTLIVHLDTVNTYLSASFAPRNR